MSERGSLPGMLAKTERQFTLNQVTRTDEEEYFSEL